jgi:carboxyl-terminal processing protease
MTLVGRIGLRTSRQMALGLCLFVLGLMLGVASGCGTPPTIPSPKTGVAYLNNLITTMQNNSVNRLKIDWVAFRAQVLGTTPDAPTVVDTYPAITVALGLLDDHHSSYRRADGAYLTNPRFPAGCAVPAINVSGLPADIGYVQVGAFGGSVGGPGATFAAEIQQRIRERDSDLIEGWIVDLRGNGGGNMWPMIAGVGPILGVGTAGSFVPPVGSPSSWGYDDRGSFQGTSVIQSVSAPYTLRRPTPRVAVLTDKGVASSGEAVVVAFKARQDTRSFGTETCGVPTANFSFAQNDGGTLILTTSLMADRTSKTYLSPIVPDESITDPSMLLARAVEWIRGK